MAKDPGPLTADADRLAQSGEMAGAERAYRAALVADRRFATAALGLANLLMWQKRQEEAAQVLAPLAILPAAPASVLDLHVRALVGAGRPENAFEAHAALSRLRRRRQIRHNPNFRAAI